MQTKLSALIDKAVKTHSLTKEEIQALLDTPNLLIVQKLYEQADQVRFSHRGAGVHLIASAWISGNSGACFGSPFYNRYADKSFKMTEKEISMMGLWAREFGFTHLILSSGNVSDFTSEELLRIVQNLKVHKIEAILDCGERNVEDLNALSQAKLRGYLLPIISSNSAYYRSLFEKDKQKQWNYRHKLQDVISDSQIDLYTGAVAGMRQQTTGMLADDLLYFQKLNPATVFWQAYASDAETILKLLALSRLLMPQVHLIAEPKLEQIGEDQFDQALFCGADIVLTDLTELFFDRSDAEENIKTGLNARIDLIREWELFEYY